MIEAAVFHCEVGDALRRPLHQLQKSCLSGTQAKLLPPIASFRMLKNDSDGHCGWGEGDLVA